MWSKLEIRSTRKLLIGTSLPSIAAVCRPLIPHICQNISRRILELNRQAFCLVRWVFLSAFLLGPLLLHSIPAGAEEGAGDVKDAAMEELRFLQEETVITPMRYEQPISEAPSNVYVITDEDIRNSGAIDIPTILRQVPGIEVMQTTAADFNVSARGDNQLVANKMLAMVDGRSIYIDSQGLVLWKMLPVTLPEIKRIEVLKGPASAVYGFNAFDGIVHIITKSGKELEGSRAQVSVGNYDTVKASAIHGGMAGKLDYRLSVGYDQTNQWRDKDALAYRAWQFNIKTSYDLPGEGELKLSGGLIDASEFDGPVTQVTLNSGKPAQGYAYLQYERPNAFIRGFWNRLTDSSFAATNPLLGGSLQTVDLTGSPEDSVTLDTYNIDAQHSLNFLSTHRLTYGANYRHNALSEDFVDKFRHENRLGMYVQDEWTPTHQLKAIASLRLDLDTFINPTYSPRFSLLYTPWEGHTFRGSVSVGYRPPTLQETYLNIRTLLAGGFFSFPTFGSKNLDPEQIISYELDYQGWYLRHRLRTRLAIFFNHISDLIDFQRTSSIPLTPVVATNLGEADIYGGEAGVEFWATPWLSGFANYAFQEVGQTLRGSPQRAAPRFKFNSGLRGDWDNGLNAEALVHYVSSTTWGLADAFSQAGAAVNPRVQGYVLVNLRGGYRFWNDKAEIAVSSFNTFDDEHREHPLGDLIKRRVMAWLTINF